MSKRRAKSTPWPTTTQSTCAWCGAKAPRYLKDEVVESEEAYKGNLKIVMRKPWVRGMLQLLLWDGETYCRLAYGHFCTTQCAIHYANEVETKRKEKADGNQKQGT